MSYFRVGVLRGGTNHNEESLNYGDFLIKNIKKAGYKPVDIFVDTNNVWHISGKPVLPANITHHVDILWNALYDAPKDRSISLPTLSKQLGVPLISENDFVFGILSRPETFREFLKRNDIKTTSHILYTHNINDTDEDGKIHNFINAVNKKLSPAWLIEALGTMRYPHIVAKNQMDLFTASHIFLDFEGEIVVSNLPVGRRAHVGIISNFRGEKQYALVPLENRHEAGYHNTFSKSEKEILTTLAKNIHALFDYPHHIGIDIVQTPHRGLVVERVHTRALQYDQSPFCRALAMLGIGHDEVINHAIKNAMKK